MSAFQEVWYNLYMKYHGPMEEKQALSLVSRGVIENLIRRGLLQRTEIDEEKWIHENRIVQAHWADGISIPTHYCVVVALSVLLLGGIEEGVREIMCFEVGVLAAAYFYTRYKWFLGLGVWGVIAVITSWVLWLGR